MKMKYDVFISYSRKDYIDENNIVIPGNVVSKIKEALTNASISYWFDEEGIYSGQNFVEKIINNIEDSQIFIFLSTANSNSSRWTSKEIASADELHKHIIPVRIDNTPYNKKVLFRISELDYIEYYSNPEKATKELIAAIKTHLAQVREDEERRLEAERRKREVERQREEDAKRKQEEEKRLFCEEQQRLVDKIKLDCTALNNEEIKLELDRQNLLIRVETVVDKVHRKELKSFVESSSPIGKKFEEQLSQAIEQVENEKNQNEQLNRNLANIQKELEVARKKCAEHSGIGVLNKKTNFIIWCAVLLSSVFLGLLFADIKSSPSPTPSVQLKIVHDTILIDSFAQTYPEPILPSPPKTILNQNADSLLFEKYRKDAENKDATAQNNLGDCYYYGRGVNKNYTLAVYWYERAADKGAWDKEAQNNLGDCYYYGKGVEKNYKMAVDWYEKAAKNNHSSAQKKLGDLYYNGECNLPKDRSQAVDWYQKAAENGNVEAMYKLGCCYELGEGVNKDIAIAKKWYKKAADNKHGGAKKALEKLLN